MILINSARARLGDDNTAYIMGMIANVFWFSGIMIGTEDTRINYLYIGLLRGFIIVTTAYGILRWYGLRTDLHNSKDFGVLNLRNIIMTLHGFSNTVVVHYLEVPIVYTISSAGPVLVYVVDFFIHGTPVSRNQRIGIAIACLGIVLAINSHLLYQWMGIHEDMHSEFNYIDSTLTTKLLAAFLFFCVMLLWTYAVVLTKSVKHSNPVHVNFHLGILLIVFNSIGLFIKPNPTPLSFGLQL